jgi:hypothetical protein
MVNTITHEQDLPDAKDLIPEVRDIQRLRWRRRVTWVIAALAAVVVVSAVVTAETRTTRTSTRPTSTSSPRWSQGTKAVRFDGPSEAAFVGSSVWIANSAGYVDELNSSTGRLIRVVRSRPNDPLGTNIAANNKYVWIEGYLGAVTQIRTSDATVVRVMRSKSLFPGFGSMAVCGGDLWVANSYSLVRVAADSGHVMRIINLTADGVSGPRWLSVQGSHLWVGDTGVDAMSDVNCATGTVTGTVNNPGGLCCEANFASTGKWLWVPAGNQLVQLNQTSGNQWNSISGAKFALSDGPIAVGDNSLWALSTDTNEATVVNLSTDSLVRIVRWNDNIDFTPIFVAIRDGKAWVLDGLGNSVYVYNAATGRLIGHLGGVGSSPGCGCLD